MKKLLAVIFIIILVGCNSKKANTPLEPETNYTFNNPYAWIGDGHNSIMDKFRDSIVTYSLENCYEESKKFVESQGFTITSDGEYFLNNFPNELERFFIMEENNSLRMTSSLEDIINHYYTEGIFSDSIKNSMLYVVDLVNSASSAGLRNYCESIESSTDDTLKTFVYSLQAIYSSSSEWLVNNPLRKTSDPIRTCGLLAADVGGALIGGAAYILGYWCGFYSWNWGAFGLAMLSGAAFTSFGVWIK